MRAWRVGVAAIAVVAMPNALGAQHSKVHRIGALTYTTGSYQRAAFLQGLGERGYVEGKNIAIEHRSPEGRQERLDDIAEELVRLKPDVIVVSSNPAVIALKKATREIPIVMTVVGDPVGAGFIQSFARPGGNITGMSQIAEELSGKRVQLLKEISPKLVRVAVLRNPTIPTHHVLWRETEAAAAELGMKLIALDFRGPDEFERLFGVAAGQRAEALIVLPEAIALARRQQIVDLAAKSRLPGIYPFPEWTEVGGLLAYGPSHRELWRRGAYYVDRILKGAKPADLPVEQPTKFELVINLKTAKALGLAIPRSVLNRADELIE